MVSLGVQFSSHLGAANAALEKERHMRHEADGRYGSGIREANKEVRLRATMAEEAAKEARRDLKIERRENAKVQQVMLQAVVNMQANAELMTRGFMQALTAVRPLSSI